MNNATEAKSLPLFLSYDDVAQLTGYRRTSIARLVQEGKIPHRKLSRRKTLFPRDEILAWIDGQGKETAAGK